MNKNNKNRVTATSGTCVLLIIGLLMVSTSCEVNKNKFGNNCGIVIAIKNDKMMPIQTLVIDGDSIIAWNRDCPQHWRYERWRNYPNIPDYGECKEGDLIEGMGVITSKIPHWFQSISIDTTGDGVSDVVASNCTNYHSIKKDDIIQFYDVHFDCVVIKIIKKNPVQGAGAVKVGKK
ncbi:MAG: hypothetical protein LBG52_07560 [Candidatus Peribacteria bacterium]|jgi:hypothetical protein|nr:hypothetical protein [Candidatus Peribacteria bacterium]